MNQRIRELATQAHEYALEVYEKRMQNEVQTQVFFYQIRDDKFAELIVQQCGVALSPMLRDMVSRGQAYDLIKEHFGVEEQVQDSKELHTCPYREEIHNDYESLCDCDEEQQHQCAMDI